MVKRMLVKDARSKLNKITQGLSIRSDLAKFHEQMLQFRVLKEIASGNPQSSGLAKVLLEGSIGEIEDWC